MSQEFERRQIKDSHKKVKQLSEPRINPLEGEWHKSLTQEYNSFNIKLSKIDEKLVSLFYSFYGPRST
ncbi:MAG: hypothetical protein ACTSPS_14235 [Promethearchaeota archaeon]